MNVLVLTGAGISAESGIPTFRGSDGLWEGHHIEEVASPRGFANNPELVHEFYNLRRRRLQEDDIRPNAAHLALADFERQHDGNFLLVTQNIDNLHQRAGSQNVLPMHGELLKARCSLTGEVIPWHDDLSTSTVFPDNPDLVGTLRPHVVWFGESPLGLEQIDEFARNCDVFLSIGTSGNVYPAAGIVATTPPHCKKIEINLDATLQSGNFDLTIRNKATIAVPEVLEYLSE